VSERPQHDPEMGEDCECFRCHIGQVVIGLPRDFKSRTYSKTPPRQPNNSYEKGIPSSLRPDGSRMPYLKADGSTMGQVEFDRKRHQIEENRAKVSASASTPSTP